MAYEITTGAVLRSKRSEMRAARGRDCFVPAKAATKLSDLEYQKVFEVCLRLFQENSFGEPSLPAYIDIQRGWVGMGDSLSHDVRREVGEALRGRLIAKKALSAAINKAWCSIAKANFHTFYRNAMRHHSRVMSALMWKQSVFIQYAGAQFNGNLVDLDGFDARWKENPTLTLLVSVLPGGSRSLGPNCFKELKQEWLAAGGSDADFRWLSKQSRSWLFTVLNLTRRSAEGIFLLVEACARLRLRGCHLSNGTVAAVLWNYSNLQSRRGPGWQEKLTLVALGRSLASHKGPAKSFNPIGTENVEVLDKDLAARRIMNMGDYFRTLERSEEIERLMASATLSGLKRRSDEWHVAMRRNAKLMRRHLQFPVPEITDWTKGDLRFQWLGSSDELWDEGDEMEHCVGGYDLECYDQQYRVFRVTGEDPNGVKVRATAGYCLQENGKWRLDQIEGLNHKSFTEDATVVAVRLAVEMNRLVDPVRKQLEDEVATDTNFALAA